MKKSSICGLLILFIAMFSMPALAEFKVFHSGWHAYNDVFNANGKVVTLRLPDGSDNLLRVSLDNMSAIIAYRECEEVGMYTVCFVNRSYDVDQVSISDTGKTRPGVELNISYYDVSTDMTITPTFGNFHTFEQYQVNVTFENKKPQWITFYNYELTLPPDVTVVKNGDFTLLGKNKLSYSGSLASNSKKTVSFFITSESASAKKITYNATITSQELTKSVSGEYSFTVALPYTMTVTASPAEISVLDTSRLIVNIKNDGDINLELTNLTIKGQNDIYYTADKGLDAQEIGKYYLPSKETIFPGKTKEYYIIAMPQYLGKYNFSVSSQAKYNGGSLASDKSASLVVSANGFVPTMSLSKDAALSGSQVELLFTVSNTNSQTIFNDITAKINGGFFSESLSLPRLNTNEEKILVRKMMTVPFVDEDFTYKVNSTIEYYTASGEKKTINLTRNLKITSAGTLLSLTHQLNQREIYEGNELIVELNIKNMKDEVFVINATDSIPKGATKIGGLMNKTLTLDGQDSESAYIYKLIVPQNSGISELNITSTAAIPAKGYTKTLVTTVKVNKNITSAALPENDVTHPESASSNGTINPEDIVVGEQTGTAAKPDGFLKRTIKGISAFFENLFS